MKYICCLLMLATMAFVPLSSAQEVKPLELGNFSVSLAVKDIMSSLAFYEKVGFEPVGGELKQNWIVLQSGSTKIGLFQGMFSKNLMTFNPGWSQDRMALEQFHDVRELQRAFRARGLVMAVKADETTQGPAHFVLTDPDGNELLFDQHVPSPRK